MSDQHIVEIQHSENTIQYLEWFEESLLHC